MIIGVLNTGYFPTHPSFKNNTAIPPPPSKWNKTCEFNSSTCNDKLIGARNFVSGMTAMKQISTTLQVALYDIEGHGTYTASTAAGIAVNNVKEEGQENGTARGMALLAHLAIYNVCAPNGCATSDIMTGTDSAIHDGVDVLSPIHDGVNVLSLISYEHESLILLFSSSPCIISTTDIAISHKLDPLHCNVVNDS